MLSTRGRLFKKFLLMQDFWVRKYKIGKGKIMSGLGSFNSEALEKLKQDYIQQLKTVEDVEKTGYSMGANMIGLETSPVPSVWASVKNWSYPSSFKEPEKYKNDLEGIDFLTIEELQEIIDDLNAPTPLEEEFSGYLEVDKDDYDMMSLEKIKALSKRYLDEYEEIEDIDLDNMSPEQFDALIESILEEMDEEEPDDDDGYGVDIDQLASFMLDKIRRHGVDVLSLSEKDCRSLVENVFFGEGSESQDSLEERLVEFVEMVENTKEEI